MPYRTFTKRLRIFAGQKYGSESKKLSKNFSFWKNANDHCSESYKKSGVEKRPSRFSLIGDARQFLYRKLRFVQCTARMPCRILAKRLRIFAKQKYGSERYTDVPRTTTARNLIRSRELKNGFAIFLLSARRLSYLILSDVIKGMKADCNSL